MSIRIVLNIILFQVTFFLNGQNLVLNGSFEINKCDGKTNLSTSNIEFDTLMFNVTSRKIIGWDSAWGGIDILSTNDFLPPSGYTKNATDGVFFLNFLSGGESEGVSLHLKEEIVKNIRYRLQFDVWSVWTPSGIQQDNLDIGLSTDSNSFGTLLMKILPETLTWNNIDTVFMAPQHAKYLTVRTADAFAGVSGNCVDNFRLQRLDSLTDTSSALNEQLLQTLEVHPNPFNEQFTVQTKGLSSSIINIKLYDVYGKEVLNQKQSLHQNGATINGSALSRGVYFIELLSEQDGKEKTIGRSKIIKK